MRVKISEKNINISGLKPTYHRLANRKKLILPLIILPLFESFFEVGEIIVLKYGHLMLPGTFPDKFTPEIDFTNETVVQCDVPVVKILLLGVGILQILKINFDVNTYVLFLDPVFFSFLRS